MVIFNSDRERKLWIITGLLLLGIYSTAFIAYPLSTLLSDSGLLSLVYILGFILVIATVLWSGINLNTDRISLLGALGVSSLFLLVFVRIEIPLERTHLIEYSILGIFIYEIVKERIDQGEKNRFPGFTALLITSVFGALDECIQYFIPNREFDPRDILFNFLAGLMAIVSSTALSWIRMKTLNQ